MDVSYKVITYNSVANFSRSSSHRDGDGVDIIVSRCETKGSPLDVQRMDIAISSDLEVCVLVTEADVVTDSETSATSGKPIWTSRVSERPIVEEATGMDP